MLSEIPDAETFAEIMEMADGLLIPGGDDVNPKLYGQEARDYTEPPDNQKDTMEYALLKEAIKRKLPILAICRGIQIVNVYQGGTLYQDVAKEMNGGAEHDCYAEDKPRSTISHEVAINGGTRLQKILGVDKIGVNSLHHQGISKIGKDLVITATAEDGLVEGVELKDYPFLVGVQWHPEELTDNPVWRKFFDAFVSEAAKVKGR